LGFVDILPSVSEEDSYEDGIAVLFLLRTAYLAVHDTG
jgi:hypothetical protein